ncbi:hypothetical protein N7532_003860 [Penicillium argentinense]|uniref:Uncharacterized protein n=1 Tax=Penicillium argentinense TaxID=1131581 RepID=A0A9W9FN85_9EURO|nr:uncharacterized protein N7532_003860 [Penicillium argentinense]KAJ5103331.1 hypothetical protein N7532_003860 [Penicillium argentinense]
MRDDAGGGPPNHREAEEVHGVGDEHSRAMMKGGLVEGDMGNGIDQTGHSQHMARPWELQCRGRVPDASETGLSTIDDRHGSPPERKGPGLTRIPLGCGVERIGPLIPEKAVDGFYPSRSLAMIDDVDGVIPTFLLNPMFIRASIICEREES